MLTLDANGLCLAQTLDCGQCFRWQPQPHGSWVGAVFCALVLGLLNATVKPVLQVLAIPFTMPTLGIFYVIVNAFVLELASWLSRNIFHAGIAIDSLFSAILGAVVISVVSMLLSGVVREE